MKVSQFELWKGPNNEKIYLDPTSFIMHLGEMNNDDELTLRGGIMADDMGVGKTAQLIALICSSCEEWPWKDDQGNPK
jgi:hypothetical protein